MVVNSKGIVPQNAVSFREFFILSSASDLLPNPKARKKNARQKSAKILSQKRGCRFVPSTIPETKPQMVPRDLNIGFQGLALIQGQIYNPEKQRCSRQENFFFWVSIRPEIWANGEEESV